MNLVIQSENVRKYNLISRITWDAVLNVNKTESNDLQVI